MDLHLIYSDHLVEVFADGIRFNNYYFPFGSKFILFSAIRSWERRSATLENGKWRLWGTGDFRTWFPLDWHRPKRAAIFILTLATQKTRIGFTVENEAEFLAAAKPRLPAIPEQIKNHSRGADMRILAVLLGIVLCMPQAVWAKAKAKKPAAAVASQAQPAAKTKSPKEIINLLALQEGTLPVVEPACYNGWTVEKVLDESSDTGWASEGGKVAGNVFVFELAVPAAIERFEFDTASRDEDGAGAKDVLVEVSPGGKGAKYETVLQAMLEDQADGQSFKADKVKPAHWVRLTIRNNHGSPTYTELFSFRGFGVKPPMPAPLDKISGTYETTYSKFHMLQQGTALQGCYEFQAGMLNGTIEGRVMKITWSEEEGKSGGPAVLTFAPDGQSFQGYWWVKGQEQGGPSGRWDGKKLAPAVGGCPHWEGSLGGEMKKKLKDEGRVQVYGILFDLDKAVIRSESRPVLDEMLEVLNGEPAWKLTIEGHTDASGSDAHNQELSQQRADAVKAYLVEGGIAADRLQTTGFGESKPVADNATELGRAQNRRVELVRQ